MVNMDSLGISTTEVELIGVDKALLAALGSTATSIKLPVTPMDLSKVGLSDSDSFEHAHIRAICFYSITQGTFGWLHSPKDRLSNVNMPNYYDRHISGLSGRLAGSLGKDHDGMIEVGHHGFSDRYERTGFC